MRAVDVYTFVCVVCVLVAGLYILAHGNGRHEPLIEMVVMTDGTLCAIIDRETVQCHPAAWADMSARK